MEEINFKLGEKYAVDKLAGSFEVTRKVEEKGGCYAHALNEHGMEIILNPSGVAYYSGKEYEIFGLYQPLLEGFRYVSRKEKPEDGIFYYSTTYKKWILRLEPKVPLDPIYHKTLYARKIETPKKLVPFDRGDMVFLRGKILARKNDASNWFEVSYFGGIKDTFFINGFTATYLLHDYTFEDGTPCGKWV
mgnify:CR=1 FL=1